MNPTPPTTRRILHARNTDLSREEIEEIKKFVTQPESPWISQQETLAFSRALAGEFAATSDDYFFLLSVDGRFVSHAWYAVSRRTPEIAVLGYVFTDPEWRGRGLSNSLLETLCEHFAARGGKAMYLGTDDPAARSVYRKHCFEDYNGEVMRSLGDNPDAKRFDNRIFEAGQKVEVRAAEWGDLALAISLYTNRSPWVVRDFTEKIILRPSDKLTRCVSIFVALMLRSEDPGNSMLVLETARGTLVGCASVIASSNEKSLLEFLVHPNYASEATSCLQSLLKEGSGFVCHAAEEDITKRKILAGLGFRELRRDESMPEILMLESEIVFR